MKKRILALSLAAAMVVGALASCTKTVEPAPSSAVEARDITLTLWGSEGDNAFLKEVPAEKYEELLEAVKGWGEPLSTASGGNLERGEVNRKGVSSTVWSHDH